MTKASVSVVDTGRKALVLSAEVKELRLISEAPWCLKVTMASNILGVVTAGFEVIHALQVWIDGESGRVVKWLSINSAVSVAASVLGFFVLGAGAGIIVGVVSIVLGVLFADWAAQELTVPQRLWIHRGVFGRHEVNYRDSEPFGGQMSEQAHAYFDCQTKKLCINQPYGGVPSSESEEAYRAYQLKALTEEKLALGMLVRGITLKVDVKVTPPPAVSYVLPADGILVSADITLTVPENTDGYIRLELSSFGSKNSFVSEDSHIILKYKKEGEKIDPCEELKIPIDYPEFIKKENMFSLNFNVRLRYVKYDLRFSLCDCNKQYVPIAEDKISFNIYGAQS